MVEFYIGTYKMSASLDILSVLPHWDIQLKYKTCTRHIITILFVDHILLLFMRAIILWFMRLLCHISISVIIIICRRVVKIIHNMIWLLITNKWYHIILHYIQSIVYQYTIMSAYTKLRRIVIYYILYTLYFIV